MKIYRYCLECGWKKRLKREPKKLSIRCPKCHRSRTGLRREH